MSYNEEDKLLKTLANKIAQLEPKTPSSEDWESFQEFYAQNKPKEKKKNRKFFFWWFLFVLGISSAVVFKYESKKSSQKAKISSKQITASTLSKPKQKASKQNKNYASPMNPGKDQNISNKAQVKKVFKRSQTAPKLFNVSREKTSPEPVFNPELSAVNPLPTSFQRINKRNSPLLENNKAWNPKLSMLSLELPLPIKDSIIKNIEQVSKKPTHKEGITTVKYLGLGGLLNQDKFQQTQLQSLHSSYGLELNGGVFLSQHWSLFTGLQASFGRSHNDFTNLEKVKETYIQRIDTSIKYNVLFNRLMMQIDTITAEREVEITRKTVIHQQLQTYSLPLQVRYHFGNEKRSLFISTGIKPTLLVHSITTTQNKGTSEQDQRSVVHKDLLLAPSIGFGLNQKLFQNYYLNASALYQEYLGNKYQNSNQFQFQLGIMYQFK